MKLSKYFVSLFFYIITSLTLVEGQGKAYAQAPPAWDPNLTSGGANSMLFKFTKQVWLNPTIIIAKQNFEQAVNVKLLILPRLNSNDTTGSSRIEKAFDKLLSFLVYQDNIQGSIKFYFDPHNPAKPFTFRTSDELHCKFSPLEKDTVEHLLNLNIANSSNLNNFTVLPFESSITQAGLYCKKILQSKPGACGPNPENEFTLTQINTTPAKLNFERTAYQPNIINGGVDKQKYAELAQHYNTIIDKADNSNYQMVWKAMDANSNDFIKLKLKKKQSSFDISKLVFKNAAGTETYSTTFHSSDSTISLSMGGKSPGSMAEVVAYYTPPATPPQTFAIGAFNVQFYQAKTLKVVLVSLNGATLPSEDAVSDTLNKIYGNVFINWIVSTATCNLPPEISKNIHIESSGLLSNYMPDMQPIVSHFKDNCPDYNGSAENTYYLLFGCTNDGSQQGYMPRARNTGFIFDVSPHTIAHELGHGAFNLKHIFSSDELGEGNRFLTNNIMDYAVGNASVAEISQQSALYKHQWDLIHDPSFVGWFEGDDEEGALSSTCAFDAGGKYFIAPNGKVFIMPAGAKIKFLESGVIQTGIAYAFEKDNKLYIADAPYIKTPSLADYSFNGFKNNGTAYPISYIETAPNVHLIEKGNSTFKIFKFKSELASYSMPIVASNNTIEGSLNNEHIAFNQESYDAKTLVITCNLGSGSSPDDLAINAIFNKLKNKQVKATTFIYQNGYIIKLAPGKPAEKIPYTANQLQLLKTQIDNGEFTEPTAVLFEKKSNPNGYILTIGYNESIQAKYGNSSAVKQKCASILENRLNEYLKDQNDLTINAETVNSTLFPDGRNIKIKQLSFFEKVVTLVSETKEFIEQAEIQPRYYDSEDADYANNWMNAPPLLSGVGNGVINEVKEIPQLVAMATDLAINEQTRDKFVNSFKNLTWDKVKSGVTNAAGTWANTYVEGGDKAWHQGGKDAVMVFTLFGGTSLLSGVDDLIENQTDDIVGAVESKADDLSNTGSALVNALSTQLKTIHNRLVSAGVPLFEQGNVIKYVTNNGNEFANIENGVFTITKAKGSIPNPDTYLDASFITNHLTKFNGEVSCLSFENSINTYGKIGRDDGLFVLPKTEMDELLLKTGGDISLIEKELGIPAGTWSNRINDPLKPDKLVRIDINNSQNHNLRMATGREDGANTLWLPGGKTSEGFSEAVIDPIPITSISSYIQTTVVQ